ncbi:1-phosphofructokinase family hexose kinase [Yinghuangia seranimata]|uniref:1-phosphofructokinase family hexose kinase n=1 Tax=Yinghuangia seranimata TaxID=408067 RepID=UPI00248C1B8D|nr:1-phosphofructokinase family hexose kinase [Yinghuangia seranimata]MDI2129489.1 1-phosphofructokinase family hexose kinase [Yinghuangia seranimata]
MILTVTLNTALDITHSLAALRPFAANRPHTVAQRAGGKGVNVSRVLHALGQETEATGLVGGLTGVAVRGDLEASGLTDRMLRIDAETRRTVAVVDDGVGDTTTLLEPGPVVGPQEWTAFLEHFEALLRGAAAVVLSGSLPRGVPSDAYAVLVRMAHDHDLPTVVDTEGEALRAALTARPELVKPNQDELAATTGLTDPVAAARSLRADGAGTVVASLGARGLIALTPQGDWHAYPPRRLIGNPTGAGDAAVAALALGMVAGTPWRERLAEAVALSAAAVAAPLAGDVDLAVHRRLRPLVHVEPLRSLTACP